MERDAASPVISESRKIYKMATLEGLIVNYGRQMASTYDKNVVLAKGLGYQDAIIFWDMEKRLLSISTIITMNIRLPTKDWISEVILR